MFKIESDIDKKIAYIYSPFDANTQVIVRDFPLPKLGEIANLNNDVEIQIVHDEYDREMLLNEKNALSIRLAEIEKKLEKQGVRVK